MLFELLILGGPIPRLVVRTSYKIGFLEQQCERYLIAVPD